MAASRSGASSRVTGIPFTEQWERMGTMVSPWVPRVNPTTSRGASPSASATNQRNRAESSVPLSASTRARGNPVTLRTQ